MWQFIKKIFQVEIKTSREKSMQEEPKTTWGTPLGFHTSCLICSYINAPKSSSGKKEWTKYLNHMKSLNFSNCCHVRLWNTNHCFPGLFFYRSRTSKDSLFLCLAYEMLLATAVKTHLKCSEKVLGDNGCGQVNKKCGSTKTSVRLQMLEGQMLVQVTLAPGSQRTLDKATVSVWNQGHEQHSRNWSTSIHLIISYCKNMDATKLRGREKNLRQSECNKTSRQRKIFCNYFNLKILPICKSPNLKYVFEVDKKADAAVSISEYLLCSTNNNLTFLN